MDRLLVVIALLAPHREFPGGYQHHGCPIVAGDRGREERRAGGPWDSSDRSHTGGRGPLLRRFRHTRSHAWFEWCWGRSRNLFLLDRKRLIRPCETAGDPDH